MTFGWAIPSILQIFFSIRKVWTTPWAQFWAKVNLFWQILSKTGPKAVSPQLLCSRWGRYMHPISGYGEMKGESSDLVRYMLSGSKTIFREFFWPSTLKISSFEIYWIRLTWKSPFLSFNLSEMRLKIASWVPRMRVPSQFPLGFHVNSIRCGLDIGRTYRDVGWDWRTIAQLFVWLKRSEHGGFPKNDKA